jgi:hypothetical protein
LLVLIPIVWSSNVAFVFRPQAKVGTYKTYEVILSSNATTEDIDAFNKAVEEVKEWLLRKA